MHRELTASPYIGGKKILGRVAGKDASKQFWKYHSEGVLKKYKPKLQVGSLDSKSKAEATPSPTPTAPEPKKASEKAVVPAAAKEEEEEREALEPFGSQIPFGDPSWYQGVSSSSLNKQGAAWGDAMLTAAFTVSFAVL